MVDVIDIQKEVEEVQKYVEDAAIKPPPFSGGLSGSGVDIEDLPNTVVSGSNMMAFGDDVGPRIRSAVADSILLAQLASDANPAVQTPKQWYDSYLGILHKKLQWRKSGFDSSTQSFEGTNVSVHEAIIPFLTAAFGPGAAVGSLIVTALQQLSEIDKEKPWITLFERESRRFDHRTFQFTEAVRSGLDMQITLVGATMSFVSEFTQVLFFKVTSESSSFSMVEGNFSAPSNLLEVSDAHLKAKLQSHIPAFIEGLDIG